MFSDYRKLAVLIVAALCTGWTHSKLPNTTQADLGEDFVPRPEVAQVASFGFDALMADYYWLQAVQVVGGGGVVDLEAASHLGRLIDVVTTVNPHVGHPYRFAAVWMTLSADQVREGNRLLRRSIEYHPDVWQNRFYLGFNHFFYLGEYPEAAEALEAAMALPGAPAYLPRLVARLKSQTGDIGIAEVFLRQILETTTDEAAVAKIHGALDEIEIEYKARHLDQARAAYQQASGGDIESVMDLIKGEHRMLEVLPSPEPSEIPESLKRGSVWELDEKTGQIVSSYLGNRYEVHYSGVESQQFFERGDPKATTATWEGSTTHTVRGGDSNEG